MILCLISIALPATTWASHPHLWEPGDLLPGVGLLPGHALAERLSSQEPGSWVEYVATLQGKAVGSYLRYVLSGRDEEGIWLELWLSSKPGSAALAFQILLEADASGRMKAKRVRQRLLGGEISELELPLEKATGSSIQSGAIEERWTTVMTGAGSFRAREVSVREGGLSRIRISLTDTLPLFGIVRLDLGKGVGLEAHAFGHGSPRVFDSPRFSSPVRRSSDQGSQRDQGR